MPEFFEGETGGFSPEEMGEHFKSFLNTPKGKSVMSQMMEHFRNMKLDSYKNRPANIKTVTAENVRLKEGHIQNILSDVLKLKNKQLDLYIKKGYNIKQARNMANNDARVYMKKVSKHMKLTNKQATRILQTVLVSGGAVGTAEVVKPSSSNGKKKRNKGKSNGKSASNVTPSYKPSGGGAMSPDF